jgi:hypothetical protein
LLLTSYGFSVFGDKAGQGALVAYLAGLLLALAGFAHVVAVPARRTFAAVEPTRPPRRPDRHPTPGGPRQLGRIRQASGVSAVVR